MCDASGRASPRVRSVRVWPLAGPRPKGKPQGARAPLTALPGSREGAILNRQTFYLDAEDTYQGIKDVDMVPSLSARNL